MKTRRKRGVAEIISYLVLMGAVIVAFAATLVVIPRYFEAYNKVGVQAAYSQNIGGYITSASLTRNDVSGTTYLTVIIHNYGNSPATVSYSVWCQTLTTPVKTYAVGGGKDIAIPSGGDYVKVYTVDSSKISGMICYMSVERGSLVYKVVES